MTQSIPIKHSPIIEDVTLTMIVRDEVINPAGGLLSVLELQAPYYPEVVIVDTGSVDGTRELLEHLSGRDFYPHIKISDHEFKGYADARNFANSKVRTKYAMVVDADEIMFKPQIEVLSSRIKESLVAPLGVDMVFIDVYPLVEERMSIVYWNPRCYRSAFLGFEHGMWERLTNRNDRVVIEGDLIVEGVLPTIYHFKAGSETKSQEWYNRFNWHVDEENPPSSCKGFMDWKRPDRETVSRYGIDLDDVIKRLNSLGINFPDETKRRLEQV